MGENGGSGTSRPRSDGYNARETRGQCPNLDENVTRQIWIFGYGSLVFRPDFPFEARQPAYVNGFARRFWQGSTDHRGVIGAPGRVVTLVPQTGARTWGVAYRVAAAEVEGVLSRLDHRERGGYARHDVPLGFRDRPPEDGLVYRATEANENYLGPAPLEDIAAQIARSRGPSGHNIDYLRQLAAALKVLGFLS